MVLRHCINSSMPKLTVVTICMSVRPFIPPQPSDPLVSNLSDYPPSVHHSARRITPMFTRLLISFMWYIVLSVRRGAFESQKQPAAPETFRKLCPAQDINSQITNGPSEAVPNLCTKTGISYSSRWPCLAEQKVDRNFLKHHQTSLAPSTTIVVSSNANMGAKYCSM